MPVFYFVMSYTLNKSNFPGKFNSPTKSESTDKPVNNSNHQNNNNNINNSKSTENSLKNLPKPPVSIRGFDLVANLPTTRAVDESEDDEEEYEAFDEQIVEQHQRNSIIRADSGQSLSTGSGSARPSSVESVYLPPISMDHEEEEVYEIYESITESVGLKIVYNVSAKFKTLLLLHTFALCFSPRRTDVITKANRMRKTRPIRRRYLLSHRQISRLCRII